MSIPAISKPRLHELRHIKMAYLHELISSIPGLEGSSLQRQKQLYERMGSPYGPYAGTKDQNLWLLAQINNGSASQAVSQPAPAQPQAPSAPSFADTLRDSILNKVTPKEDFSKLLSYSDFFDTGLAKEGIGQQVNRYFDPIEKKGTGEINTGFANRGLFRSGFRNKAQTDYRTDVADQRQTMSETLFNTRDQQARERYNEEQNRYEKDPTNYKKPIKPTFTSMLNG